MKRTLIAAVAAMLALSALAAGPGALRTDAEEAFLAGAAAVRAALESGVTKGTIGILREEGRAYRVAYAARPIADAAKETRSLPREFIAKNGHDVTQAFIDYARPIVGDLPPCAVI